MSDELVSSFEDFNINTKLLSAVKRLGFDTPTEIQAKSIPFILEGKDVVGESATGSGKTLAFAFGAIEGSVPKKGVQALILVPTRELAEQVSKAINELNVNKTFRVLQIYGGVSITPQMDALRSSEIVVATPGRLKDHIQRGTIDLSRLKLLVLDEADRMLDMGFIPDIEDIVKQCPKKRQTLLFSATFPPQIKSLTRKFLSDPVSIKVDNQVDAKLLKQVYYDVRRGEKLSLLIHLIKNEESDRIMIFCNTRINSDLIHQNLLKNNIKSSVLHGGFTQASRTHVIDNFKSGKCKVLVCTDVAARGIHVDDVSHVYNYDMSKDANDYVHRIGRTARAGSEGLVVNLVSDMDHDNFSRVFANYDFNIEKLSPPDGVAKIKFDSTGAPRGRGDSRDNRGRSSGGNRNSNRPRSEGERLPERRRNQSGSRNRSSESGARSNRAGGRSGERRSSSGSSGGNSSGSSRSSFKRR